MAAVIKIPYSRQLAEGYCLPACAQMVFAHLGISRSQPELARTLGVIENLGVPASQVIRLRSRQVEVIYQTESSLVDIDKWLQQGIPVIACVQTRELSYWRGQVAQHVVLVVGMDQTTVYLLDPGYMDGVTTVSTTEFFLAWDEMALAYAVIYRRK